MNARIENAKQRILDGAKFNGIIYAKRANNNNTDLRVYLDGELVHLSRVDPSYAEEFKAEIAAFFNIEVKSNFKRMTYSEAFEKYGFDFAEEAEY